MSRLQRVIAGIRGSGWLPIVGKLCGLSVALVLLGLLGSGALDRWLSPRAAFAGSHDKRQRPALSSVAASLELPTGAAGRAPPGAASAVGSAAASGQASAAAPTSAARTADGKVILNLAEESDLAGLPGVGPKKAKAILELRAKLGGRFKRLEELMRVRGIKRKFLERLRPHVVLDPPA